jgi:hypothetical protein
LTAYVALEQYNLSRTLTALNMSEDGLIGYAAWNAIAAAITLFFGARMLTTPTRKQMTNSIMWSALSTVAGAIQVAGGTTYEPYVLSVIAAATAGVLSYVARQATPVEADLTAPPTPPVAADRPAAVDARPTETQRPPQAAPASIHAAALAVTDHAPLDSTGVDRSTPPQDVSPAPVKRRVSGRRTERLLLLVAAGALLVLGAAVGAFILGEQRGGPLLATAATLSPSPTATLTPTPRSLVRTGDVRVATPYDTAAFSLPNANEVRDSVMKPGWVTDFAGSDIVTAGITIGHVMEITTSLDAPKDQVDQFIKGLESGIGDSRRSVDGVEVTHGTKAGIPSGGFWLDSRYYVVSTYKSADLSPVLSAVIRANR